MINIGGIQINGYAALAPMAGVADRAMREICVNHGAAFTVGELTSAKGVCRGDRKSEALLSCFEGEGVAAAQLFGCDPGIMARAAVTAQSKGSQFIDINMGCPAPKVAGNGGGSALLRDCSLAARVVEAVVKAVDIPVTVKMRIGWDEESLVAPEIARLCESVGAAAVTVHGRTRVQMYAPPVNYGIIRAVKQSVGIPVIGNGDVTDAQSALYMYRTTGCDMVMVGRAARGNPFVFDEINAFFENRVYTPPTLTQRLDECMQQTELMLRYKDPHIAMLEARKHTAWYLTGLKSAAELRRECGAVSCLDDIKRIFEKALELNSDLC